MNISALLGELVEQGIELYTEDGRLRYRAPQKSLITPEVLATLKQHKQPILDYLQQHGEIGPLSHGQRALWFLHQNAKESAAYHIAVPLHICSAVNVTALKQALTIMIERHPLLRAFFPADNGKPIQKIRKKPLLSFTVVEVPNIDDKQLKQQVNLAYQAPFFLEECPLLRVHLFSRSSQDNLLLMTVHHIIFDGWSIWRLMDELQQVYAALVAGQSLQLPKLHYHYKDWIWQQNKMLSGQQGEQLWHYWQEQLNGTLPVLQLPTDSPRPSVPNYRGASVFFELDPTLSQSLKRLAQAEEVTLFTLLLAVFQVLLHRYSRQDDILMGSPVAGREQTEFNDVIGYFVNMIVLRAHCGDNPTFRDFLALTKETVLNGLTHQEYPFPLLVERLKPERHAGHSPLFQVFFDFQPTQLYGDIFKTMFTSDVEQTRTIQWGGLTIKPFAFLQQEGQFDLALEMGEYRNKLSGIVKFNTDLFDKSTVERLCGHYSCLLEAVVLNPAQSIDELPLLTAAEREQLQAWNRTETDYPQDKTLTTLFEEQVKKTPDTIAVVFDKQQLSYLELNAKANQLAHYLLNLKTDTDNCSLITDNCLVGICVERSLEMVIGLLGILKAGGAYVPLDPDYPASRLQFMLEDSQVPVLLTQSHLIAQLPTSTTTVVALDKKWEQIAVSSRENPVRQNESDNLAYVIYTSGSTGKPKGVMIEHHALVNFLQAMQLTIGITQQDKLAAVTTLSFDIAALELYLPLVTGAQIILISRDIASDGDALKQQLVKQAITIMQATPATWKLLLLSDWSPTTPLTILCGGEALSTQLGQTLLKNSRQLWNVYGPTETTIWSTAHPVIQHPEQPTLIGKPIANTQIYILDANHNPTPLGIPGELCIAGVGLARGYLNRPELTAEKFIEVELFGKRQRIYKTGDLARWNPDGHLEYLGRLDHQIKLRGFRIELGEIEAVLGQYPRVQENVVIVQEDSKNGPRLIAYLVPEPGQTIQNTELRRFLKNSLPDYMIPSVFVSLETMPLTPNGKIDRRALQKPEGIRPQLEAAYVMPQTEAEQKIAQVWQKVLHLDKVGIYDNFFEVGGHSLLMTQVQNALQALFVKPLSVVELFQYPTIQALATHLTQEDTPKPTEIVKTSKSYDSQDIAIIGMAGRFPGAKDIERFWQNLCEGVESIRFFSDEELLAEGIDPALLHNPNYVKANGILEDIEWFDGAFFGYSPREAEIMDPQQRLFLECAWEAIENAGYNVDQMEGSVGIYAGVNMNTYFLNHLHANRELLESVTDYQLMISNDKDFMPTRASYKLNLKGPSVNVQTACSTSLVAVDYACQSLREGKCDMALAGGVAIHLPQNSGYLYQQEMILSPDGHCRAFDANAQGTVGGSGVGLVVLKRLEDALAEGDYIHAVIKSSAINNDGALKVGYTAPSVEGQAAVIADAMREIDPETITYIETHGTGTLLGDPIEIAALTQAYQSRTDKKCFCAIGSVKTNVGHLDTAAGITGLIKTVLALKHKMLPPSLHFEQPNPKIDFANSPFFVNTTLSQWNSDSAPRRAGVSSFGIGGTNAHAILEEAPTQSARNTQHAKRPWHLLVLSAKTASALEQATTNLANYLTQHSDLNLGAVAYTLSQGRKRFAHRRMLVCKTLEEATEVLSTLSPERLFTQAQEAIARPVVFMFSGQGSQYVNMALALYQYEPLFREQVARCADLLQSHLGLDLRQILYPSAEQTTSAVKQLEQTAIAQPALFVIEYALAQLWMAWGLKPVAMIGHSIGEYVAACLAGVFSLEDALALVAVRGQLMQSLPNGAMLSVPLPEASIQTLLTQELSLAAHNAPSQCVVSGTIDAIATLKNQLTAQGVECLQLHTSHAFHSAMMEPILDSFRAHLTKIRLNPPTKPYLSNLTGTWITAELATDPDYWVRHLRFTVRFSEGLQVLLENQASIFLEIGPGRTLKTLAQQHAKQQSSGVKAFYSIRHPKEQQANQSFLLTTLGQLWLEGATIEWSRFYATEVRQRLPLPTYPFERQRYWIEPPKHENHVPQVSLGKKADIADWFYRPVWKQSVVPVSLEPKASVSWLVFCDDCGLSAQLLNKLANQANQYVITVRVGSEWSQISENEYTLNPQKREDYEDLLKELRTLNQLPQKIIHLWMVTPNEYPDARLEWVDKVQDLGFYSLLFLAQTLEAQLVTDKLQITVISNNIQPVTGEEELCPEKATVLGAVKIIPLEYSNITCRSIDIQFPQSGRQHQQALINQLWTELSQQDFEPAELIIAYRGPYRWVQTFDPIQLTDQPENRNARLREKGVYLITGGFGGMGLTFADHFAKTLQAKLILLGRSDFPAPMDWKQWLSTHPEDDAVSLRIRKIQELEKLGAEVLVMSADVADLEQMQAVIATTEKRFGQINGVIHSAGVVDYAGIIAKRTSREMTDSILAPKVNGTMILDTLLKAVELDFFMLCSSWGTVNYQLKMGEVGYCAANDFLDIFCFYKTFRDNTFTVAINWNDWQEVGMSVKAIEQHRDSHLGLIKASEARIHALQNTLSPSEGIEVLTRVLASTSPRIVVSSHDLRFFIEENTLAVQNLTRSSNASKSTQTTANSTYARPELSNAYVAPRNHLEQTLANIWQKLLGIEQVGIHDNFFHLGGDSLLATQVISQVRDTCEVKLSLQVLFEESTVARLANYIDLSRATQSPATTTNNRSNLPPIRSIPPGEDIPLSFAQQHLRHALHKKATAAHNIPVVLKLEGQLNVDALRLSFKTLIQRHDSLRMSFPIAETGQAQVYLLDIEDPLEIVNLQSVDEAQQHVEMNRLIAENAQVIFDLSTGPLWRICLLQIGEREHILLGNIHHIITDGWSNIILAKEMSVLYNAYSQNRAPQLPPLTIQYQDYAYWQHHALTAEVLQQQSNYWTQQLSELPKPLALPTDRPRLEQPDYRSRAMKHRISVELMNPLNQLSREHNVTLFMTLLAALNVLFYRYSGQTDICIASPASRRHYGNENIVGFFLTLIVLRTKITDTDNFAELLKQTQQTCLDAYAHQDINFGQFVAQLNNPSDHPIFNVLFALQIPMKEISTSESIEPPGLTVTPIEEELSHALSSTDLDLSLEFTETANGLDCLWEYNADFFDSKRIRRMIEDYEQLLKGIVENPQQSVSTLPLSSDQ